MNWDDLMSEKSYSSIAAYCQSKLANVLFTRELAKRLEGTKVTVNALHPGAVRTELQRYASETYGRLSALVYSLVKPFIFFIFKNPCEGAQTNIYCAVSEDLDDETGKYFSDCREKKLMKHALRDDDAAKLWQVSEKLTMLSN